MTTGEQMVWAVAFVASMRDQNEPTSAAQASRDADAVLLALRYGGNGAGWAEMVGKQDTP